MHEQHIGKGVTFGVLAAVSYTAMSLFGKIIGEDASTDTILFSRFLVSLILILPWVIKNPKEALLIVKPTTLITRSAFTLLAFASFFWALKFIPLSNALLLNNTFPLFVPIVALCIGFTTPPKVWVGILIGFIGVALVLKPETGFFHLPSIIALVSGILAAITIVIIRNLTKTTPVVQILFYNFLICSILTAIFLPFGWKSFGVNTFLLLLGVGIFGTAYQFFSTLAYAKAPVRITSSLMFLCIVFGIVADGLIWHKIPDAMTLTGMALVIVGGIVTIYFGQREIMKK